MIIVERFGRGGEPRAPPSPQDTVKTAIPWPPSPPHCTSRLLRRLASGVASLPPRSLQNHLLHRRSRQNRAAGRSRGDKLATAIVGPPSTPPANAPPTQAAALSNPHRRQTPTQRPAGSFLGGFRTPALTRADRSERAGIRNPSPKLTFMA